jgi:hypothetical protein
VLIASKRWDASAQTSSLQRAITLQCDCPVSHKPGSETSSRWTSKFQFQETQIDFRRSGWAVRACSSFRHRKYE